MQEACPFLLPTIGIQNYKSKFWEAESILLDPYASF
jgi:hypothetical protein